MAAEDVLDAAARQRGAEWGLRCEVGTDCAWSAEARWTPEPNRKGRPDRSYVTFAAGGLSADHAADRAVYDLMEWLSEVGS